MVSTPSHILQAQVLIGGVLIIVIVGNRYRSRGYFIVDREPTQQILLEHSRVAMVVRDEAGYNAVRTPMDLPVAQEAIEAVKSARKD